MGLWIVMGALRKSHAPVHAPDSKSLLLLIFSVGCMRCIKSLHNTSITFRWDTLNLGSHAPDVPEVAAYLKIAFFMHPFMHPRVHWILAARYRWVHEVHHFLQSNHHFWDRSDISMSKLKVKYINKYELIQVREQLIKRIALAADRISLIDRRLELKGNDLEESSIHAENKAAEANS